MILYSQQNVYEATKDRLRMIFSLGRRVAVAFSGGKDSTVVLNLTLEVAKELGIERVPVFFIDQECEYTETVNYVREVMARPDVEPYWIQAPFRLWNANNGSWFTPWEPGKEWMRQRETTSYHENMYGVDRFKDLFPRIAAYHFGDDCIYLGGLRIEESMTRRRGLIQGEALPGITWGKRGEYRNIVCLYPIFDWSYKDVWYYIFENRHSYCRVYNYLFSKLPLSQCRVSSLIHENSNRNIPLLQEIDPEAYNAMYKRIPAIGTVNHILLDIFDSLTDHPVCFADWEEYDRYLVENLLAEEHKPGFIHTLEKAMADTRNWTEAQKEDVMRTFAKAVITEDFTQSKMTNTILKYKNLYKYEKGNAEYTATGGDPGAKEATPKKV